MILKYEVQNMTCIKNVMILIRKYVICVSKLIKTFLLHLYVHYTVFCILYAYEGMCDGVNQSRVLKFKYYYCLILLILKCIMYDIQWREEILFFNDCMLLPFLNHI